MEAGLEDSAEFSAREVDVVLSCPGLHPALPAGGTVTAAVDYTEANRFLNHSDLGS